MCRRRPSRLWGLCETTIPVILAWLVAGCGEPPAALPAPDAEPQVPESLPAPGRFELRLADDRVWLRSQVVSRAVLLLQLAETAGFAVEAGELPERALTLRLEGEPLGQAVAAVLEGMAFEVAYGYDEQAHRHRLVRVRVGEQTPTPGAPAESSPAPPPAAVVLRDLLATQLEGDTGDAEQEQRRAQTEARADALSRLGHPNPVIRADAVSYLEPSGPELPQLRSIASNDPDPRVRAAAVSQLAEGESYVALEGVIEALDDPDPAVVIEAIEELALQDDTSVVRYLRALQSHEDPEIAAAATEAVEFLEF